MHPLKAWVGPSIVKRGRREDFMGWAGVEEVSVDMGLNQLKVISRGEDGGWEWVTISGGHRNKRHERVGESAGSVFIHFDSEGVLSIRKTSVSSKDGFRADN